MNMVLVALILVIAFLLLILFYLLSINKKTTVSSKKQLSNNSKKKIDLKDISFPKNIESMDINTLSRAFKSIFDSYKSLDYANKPPNSLDKIEWHTWQVSILLIYLKNKNKFIVANNKIFHNLILALKEQQIDEEIQRILKKYFENANIENDRDKLSRDIIWTARDVSIIFLKIINCK